MKSLLNSIEHREGHRKNNRSVRQIPNLPETSILLVACPDCCEGVLRFLRQNWADDAMLTAMNKASGLISGDVRELVSQDSERCMMPSSLLI